MHVSFIRAKETFSLRLEGLHLSPTSHPLELLKNLQGVSTFFLPLWLDLRVE